MIDLHTKKVLIFDLDDTLAESKQPLDQEMSEIIKKLIAKGFFIAVTSGGSFEQFKSQFLSNLKLQPNDYEKIYLLPTSGAALYRFVNGAWVEFYMHTLSQDEKYKITTLLSESIKTNNFWIEDAPGGLIEDRGTQISYSGLGQSVSLNDKKGWDPDQRKRKIIVASLREDLPDYDIKIGGRTTIDITQKGINKAFGINQLSQILLVPINKMIYFGDALFPGGNDATVLETGIEAVTVSGVSDTKNYLIKNFLS
ncbi:MAG: HAD-IIB family hydrolase [bacterium]|nr:HAD-IIB family hydrolase [bacterium]